MTGPWTAAERRGVMLSKKMLPLSDSGIFVRNTRHVLLQYRVHMYEIENHCTRNQTLQAGRPKNSIFFASICHAITDPPVTKIRLWASFGV